jgi:hypothetical protein
MKVGTLASILAVISGHLRIERDEILRRLQL